MTVNALPTLGERVAGSPVLRRRQVLGREMGRLLARIDVRGAQHVPPHGPVVLAANHRAFLDGPLLFGLVERPANFLVKVEAFNVVTAAMLRSAGQIPIERTRFDPAPVRLCLDILRAGGVVGVFPEGSRGDGRVRTTRPGVGYFALRTGALVVPVACHGTELPLRRRTLARPIVRITFGEPIVITPVGTGRRVNRRAAAEAAEHVRGLLAALVADTAPQDTNDRRTAA